MGTIDLRADRSSVFASGTYKLGGGADDHLPIADAWQGLALRGVFDFPAIPWGDATEVVSAVLTLTSTAQVHVPRGTTPQALLRRVTSQWSPNAATDDGAGNWTTAPDVWPGPSVTGAGELYIQGADGNNVAASWDITPIVMAWAPSSVLSPWGGAGQGAKKYGLELIETVGSSHFWEVYSARVGTVAYQPRLVITTKEAPTLPVPGAPNLTAPLGPEAIASTFRFSFGAAITSWDLDLSSSSSFGTMIWAPRSQAGSITGGTAVAAPYTGSVLAKGTTYYWRARGANATGTGAWSATGSFITPKPVPPAAPTLTAPLGTLAAAADDDVFRFAFGTPVTSWDLDVSTVSTFASWLWGPRGQTGSITGGTSVAVPYAGTALAQGTTYYWRARGTSVDGTGSWSATGTFTTAPAVPPVVTRDVYAEWASAILSSQAAPRTLLVPGTIRPTGAQVAALATADLADRIVLDLSDSDTPLVVDTRLAGMAVEVDNATGWTITAVLGVDGPLRSS